MISRYFRALAESVKAARQKLLIDEIKQIKSRKSLLDLGCDDGEVTKDIAIGAGIKEIFGLDLSQERVKEANQRGVKAYQGDISKLLPFKDKQFDVIMSIQTIEHLIDIDIFLEEAHRILAKGGSVIITTENLASWHNIAALLLGLQPFTGPYLSKKYTIGLHPLHDRLEDPTVPEYRKAMPPHLNVMTTRSLMQLLQKHGFNVVSVKGIGYYPLPHFISNFFAKLDPYHSAVCLVRATT